VTNIEFSNYNRFKWFGSNYSDSLCEENGSL
jgi:hypothetical protein